MRSRPRQTRSSSDRSGSGKSTLACGLIFGMNAGGPTRLPHSFVIDVGNSFKRTILYLGGSCLDLSPEQGTCINPFDLEAGQYLPTPEKTKFLTALFDEILGDAGSLSKLERAVLETEIILFYKEHKQKNRTLSTSKPISKNRSQQRSGVCETSLALV